MIVASFQFLCVIAVRKAWLWYRLCSRAWRTVCCVCFVILCFALRELVSLGWCACCGGDARVVEVVRVLWKWCACCRGGACTEAAKLSRHASSTSHLSMYPKGACCSRHRDMRSTITCTLTTTPEQRWLEPSPRQWRSTIPPHDHEGCGSILDGASRSYPALSKE